jgi:hypothetical protein
VLRFTGNSRGVRLIIAALLVVAIIGGARCARGESVISVGPVWVGGSSCDFSALTISREFQDRRVLAGIQTRGDGDCKGEFVDPNIAAFGLMLFPVGRRLDLGFGAGVWAHGDIAVGDASIVGAPEPRRDEGLELVAAILIRTYWFRNRLVLDLPLHFSSGGSTRHNPGLNMVAVGYRF